MSIHTLDENLVTGIQRSCYVRLNKGNTYLLPWKDQVRIPDDLAIGLKDLGILVRVAVELLRDL